LGDTAAKEAAASIRPLMQRLEIHPLLERGRVRIKILGLIEHFLGTTTLAKKPRTAMMVEEECYRHYSATIANEILENRLELLGKPEIKPDRLSLEFTKNLKLSVEIRTFGPKFSVWISTK